MIIKNFNDVKKEFPTIPDKILFYSYKMYPREVQFQYQKHRYFIYVYLDPFKEYIKDNQLGYIKDPNVFFGYEPFYIGKGVNGHGYRFNQHLSSYLSGKEKNQYKINKFKEIEEKMKSNKYPDKPRNWNDFKNTCILIYKTFSNEQELLENEMLLINKIGIIGTSDMKYKGPLTNKINSFQQQKYRKRIEDEFYS